jgi:hypothetical protein
LVLALAACGSGGPAPAAVQTVIPVAGPVDKVDILFMMDNSPGTALTNEARASFPSLAAMLDLGRMFGVSYHIGVVTSDLGAGPFTIGGGQCHPDGDGGKLQLLGAAADTTCKPVTGGVPYIEYERDHTNLPDGQDLPTTFGCMSAVGDKGCGFEQPLESVYRALHDPPPENAGFLRDDALLVVFFVTDEDDCSMPADSDVPDPSNTSADYGPLLSYRCTHFGVSCNGMLMPNDNAGPFTDCRGATAAEGGKLFDPQRYIDFFTKPRAEGGIKDDPGMVVLGSISAPASPVQSMLANPSPTPPGPYQSCPGPADGMKCAVVLQHSCVTPMNTQFFGDPAVRLRQVVDAVAHTQETTMCQTSYQTAMDNLGSLITSAQPLDCLPSAPLDPAAPDCTATKDGQPVDWSVVEEPHCASGYRLSVEGGATAKCALAVR